MDTQATAHRKNVKVGAFPAGLEMVTEYERADRAIVPMLVTVKVWTEFEVKVIDVSDAFAPQVPTESEEIPVALAPTPAAPTIAGKVPMPAMSTTPAHVLPAQREPWPKRQLEGCRRNLTCNPTAPFVNLFSRSRSIRPYRGGSTTALGADGSWAVPPDDKPPMRSGNGRTRRPDPRSPIRVPVGSLMVEDVTFASVKALHARARLKRGSTGYRRSSWSAY